MGITKKEKKNLKSLDSTKVKKRPVKVVHKKRVEAAVGKKEPAKFSHDHVVPRETIIKLATDLRDMHNEVTEKCPEIVPQFNEAIRGLMNLDNACESRFQRAKQEHNVQVQRQKEAEGQA